MKSRVVLRSLSAADIKTTVEECLIQCEWEAWLSTNARVVIKPNLCTAVPQKVPASNTDVVLMEALCEALRTRTSHITVGESGHLRQNPWQAFAVSGYLEMAKRLGVKLVNFSEDTTVQVKLEPAGKIPMPRQLLESDVYINVPVLKTHALTYFTGALKNQWGCVPDCHDRLRYHRSINLMLSSLQQLLQPKFVLMDAIIGMEGRGPVAGNARRLDLILASRDAVALDATAMRLVGLAPEKARHVMIAATRGLGQIAVEKILVDGEWDRLATQFAPPPRDLANTIMFFVTQYPWFVKNILGNDRVYYPIRDAVVFIRKFGLVTK